MGTESISRGRNSENSTILPSKNGLGVIITDPQERGRFLRFAFVGAIGFIVDFGVFNLLVNLAHVPAVWAQVVSFTAAVISNFLWNRYWTYPDSRSKAISHQVVQFLVISFIGLGIRTPLFAWLEKILDQAFNRMLPRNFPLTSTFVGHNVALMIVVFIVMMWNFFANRYWTYNDVS
jgi:putative flippase GtrA